RSSVGPYQVEEFVGNPSLLRGAEISPVSHGPAAGNHVAGDLGHRGEQVDLAEAPLDQVGRFRDRQADGSVLECLAAGDGRGGGAREVSGGRRGGCSPPPPGPWGGGRRPPGAPRPPPPGPRPPPPPPPPATLGSPESRATTVAARSAATAFAFSAGSAVGRRR